MEKRSEDRAERQEALPHAEAILDALREPSLSFGAEHGVETADAAFYRTFEVACADTEVRREYAETIADAPRDAVMVLDWDRRVKIANETFHRLFRVAPEETEGRMVWEHGDGQWDAPQPRRLLGEMLPDDDRFDDFERIGRRIMGLDGRRLDHFRRLVPTIEDRTAREPELRNAAYRARVRQRVTR
jgi:PAS domain-containing protein